ncbi:SWI/SNF-related matrix-associated actin-dependent regulator of chromatin subfamily A-like protein 1 [Calliopsis andreniformis]|uniref:SWI/SNF-related matrix-associated actin-dependent regulator of chromatin subfamily A-like protein 1 n=1 Tax=Calliopsis andreniformis TaxID=337506 RepID=UPI003FCE3C57
MSYSHEQIEEKRQLALQRKQAQINKSAPNFARPGSSIPSTSCSILSDQNKSFNANNSLKHRRKQNQEFKRNYSSNKPKQRFNPIDSQNFFGQKSRIIAKCYMISDNRFVLETSSYFPPLIESLKTITSKSYDIKTKLWSFNLKDYEILMEKLVCFKSEIQTVGLPRNVLQIFRNSDTSDHINIDMDLSTIDPQLLDSLMPFQREGICYGISKNGRCMIADDMGLGKTIQALGIAHYFRKDWPLLIIVPSSVRYQWAEAIFTFLPSVPAHYIHHFTNAKDFIDDNKIVIISYDLLVRAINTFQCRTFGFVIVDESHALKSVKTARFKAVQRVVSRALHVILLTGTPVLSRPLELYSQINLIMPNFMGYQEYGVRYCAGEKMAFGWDFSGSSNMQELQLLLKHTCVIRRLKNNVLNQLPSKTREVIMLDPDLIKVGTKEMVEMSKKLERKVLTGVERHTALLQYYNESSFAKQRAICDYVEKLFKEKQKCLIFAHHQNILDAICDVAESMNIKYVRIDGKTNPERRKYQVDKFQNCEDYIVAILSITAANAGITLTAAQLVVFAELFWNPGILCQAEDRVHRIGQDDKVIIRYLVAKQTADDYLWPLIQRKMNVLNEVGLDQDFCLRDISITKHALNTKQKTLDFFACSQKQDTEEVQNNENDKSVNKNVLSKNDYVSSEELKELLELSEEDFNFCDWDDME